MRFPEKLPPHGREAGGEVFPSMGEGLGGSFFNSPPHHGGGGKLGKFWDFSSSETRFSFKNGVF